MKRLSLIIASVVVLVLCFNIFSQLKDRAAKRRRAELQMLDTIKAGVFDHISSGGELPTNWQSLSNVVRWESVANMYQDNFIPPVTESYTILAQPVLYRMHVSKPYIFLVGSKPRRWSGHDHGRWMLGASSNRVVRTWLDEDHMTPELRSQLTN